MVASNPVPPITLFRGFPVRCCYVASPFVNKLEARLRIGGVPYRVGSGSVFAAPRRKLPYVEVDNDNDAASSIESGGVPPRKLADSTLIARRFIEDGYMEDLNAGLTPAERAKDLAVRALLEDKLYFYQVRERWIDNYYTMRDTVLAHLPLPVRVLAGYFISRQVSSMLHGQGTLRFTADEAAALRLEVWESVNAMLVESRNRAQEAGKTGPFWVLGGPTPTEADPTLFGFVASALNCSMAPATEEIVRGFPVIMEYAGRIHDQYFSDYERWRG